MPPTKNPFPHLSLVLRYDGSARFPQPVIDPDARSQLASETRLSHSEDLAKSASSLASAYKLKVEDREKEDLPILPRSMSLMLEVDTTIGIDELQKFFGFELVSEHEDGFLIVATEDLDLNALLKRLQDFTKLARGSASVAKIHELYEDDNNSLRLSKILSEGLLAAWPTISDEEDYVVDAGIACAGSIQIPAQPRPPKRIGIETDQEFELRKAQTIERREAREAKRLALLKTNGIDGSTLPPSEHREIKRLKPDTDEDWARKQANHSRQMSAWHAKRVAAYSEWERLGGERGAQVSGFVNAYNGSILGIYNEPGADPEAKLSEDFTLRIQINGKGLKDLVLNYPYLFEVVEPDDVALPQALREANNRARDKIAFEAPPKDAPNICVIDSGIQEGHYWLEKAIDGAASWCLLPGESASDGSDYSKPSGHGTRIAGAILFGEKIPTSGRYQLPFWIQNARVLNREAKLPERLFPPAMLNAIVKKYYGADKRTRLYNHSIASGIPCRTRHMSAWAAEIDSLSHNYDILIVVSSGNIPSSGTASVPGIREHLISGRNHPEYLCEPASRVANPAQSLQALTVGSIGYGSFETADWRSFAEHEGYPSSFSRSGLGIWGSIKPEVVEFGGDNLVSRSAPHRVDTPDCGQSIYPELIRSTLHGPGPAFSRDTVGTSFAAPKVTRIAALLQEVLPNEPCLLYRALIVQSARWPEWSHAVPPNQLSNVVRWIGYGLPNAERATSNSDFRTTLITSGPKSISPGGCHIFQVAIPPEIRRPGDEFDIRIEITLSYSAEPRRTRIHRKNYLSSWVDWKTSGKGESLDEFRRRSLKSDEAFDAAGEAFQWTLATQSNHGIVRDVSRNSGTVQKDWAIAKSNTLPKDFCIAVVGHRGWSKDPETVARYAVAVSFEVVGEEIPIYQPIRVSNDQLQIEIETEVEIEVEILG